jgi:hypothetical protein
LSVANDSEYYPVPDPLGSPLLSLVSGRAVPCG